VDVNVDDPKSLIEGADFSQDDILEVVRELPEGYRMVFNLYALEGYKHKEIAEVLDIDVATSKSQLSRARRLIQKHLYALAKERYWESMEVLN